jgi:nitroreductase
MLDTPTTLPVPTFRSADAPVLIRALEDQTSAVGFAPAPQVDDALITELIRLATRAPSAFNLQNWRFLAVRSPEAKARLRQAAYGQIKVEEAAVTFIILGRPPRAEEVAERLAPAVAAGVLPGAVAETWTAMVRDAFHDDPQARRDEAIRSASLVGAGVMRAAQAHGLASCAMTGFDPVALTRTFDLEAEDLPVLLVAVGGVRPGDRAKPRRPVADLLALV